MSVLLYIVVSVIIRGSVVSCFRLNIVSDIETNSVNDYTTEHPTEISKKVCIIGAGISGLSAARYLKEEGFNFTVFEATRYVGGTWRYDPRVGTDENGLPLHTSAYKNLRTNAPKPLMELPGFPFQENLPSFPGWQEYYEYIQAYAKHFDIDKYIQFLHEVILVQRVNNVWKVKHQHVQTKEIFEEEYDYVIVGNGRFSKPNMPNITREDLFKGSIIHSHDYKTPDPYEGRRVLVIGAGASGMDISIDVSKVAKKVVHSHHSRMKFTTPFVSHHIRKPDVKEFNETGAIFKDGTYEELDDVIYCTGYQLNYEFLHKSCGLFITYDWVHPLYKGIVNINHPSMVILGYAAASARTIDEQARYATALVKGNFTLPFQKKIIKRRLIQPYLSISEEAGIEAIPPVVFDISEANSEAYIHNIYTFRDYTYTVIDDHNFTTKLETNVKKIKEVLLI